MLKIARAGRTVRHSCSNSYGNWSFLLIWSIILSPTFLSANVEEWPKTSETGQGGSAVQKVWLSEDWNCWKHKVRPSVPLGYCRQPEKRPIKQLHQSPGGCQGAVLRWRPGPLNARMQSLGEVFWWGWNIAHFSSKMKCFQNILPTSIHINTSLVLSVCPCVGV